MEDLFSKYSSLSENINPERAIEEFSNDWQEYIMLQKRKLVHKKIANKCELISNSLKDSLLEIERVLRDGGKFIYHLNKKDLDKKIKWVV